MDDEVEEEETLTSFPFSLEEQYSKDKLKILLANCVKLGQWELARGCLHTLIEHVHNDEEKEEVKNIFLAIHRNPHLYCQGSPSLPSPYHLSWLTLVEIEDLFPDLMDQLPHATRKQLEFNILLHSLKEKAPFTVLQELSCYHTHLLCYRPKSTDTDVPEDLSIECLEFLKKFAEEDIETCKELTDYIVYRRPKYQRSTKMILKLYTDLMFSCLEMLDQVLENIFDSEPLKKFLRTLAIVKSYYTAEDEEIIDLIKRFVKKTFATQSPNALKDIYGCLCDSKSLDLLRVALNVAWQVSQDEYELQDTDNGGSMKISTLLEEKKLKIAQTVSSLLLEDSDVSWMKLFQLTDHCRVNFVQVALESALNLIRKGNIDEASRLLQPKTLQPLCALILLLAWPSCSSYSDAQLLLEKLWKSNSSRSDPLLEQACKRLEFQVQIISWCLEKTRTLMDHREKTSHQLVTKMFQRLDSHSVLFVLNQTKLLKALSGAEVLEILRKQPIGDTREVEFGHTSDPKIRKEVTMYLCFQILRKFVELLMKLNCDQTLMKESHKLANESLSTDDFVSSTVNDLKDLISQIHPLTLRLELLENLFALLFLRGQDLIEALDDDVDSVCEQTHSLDSSISESMESFSTIDIDVSAKDFVSHPEKSRPVQTSTPTSKGTHLSQEPPSYERHPSGSVERARRQLYDDVFDESDFEILNHGTSDSMTEESTTNRKNSASIGSGSETVGAANSEEVSAETPSRIYASSRIDMEGLDFSDLQRGFLVDGFCIGPILEVLNECLIELTAEKYAEQQGGQLQGSSLVKSSVQSAKLDQHVSRLVQCVKEAQWRLQLVSGFDHWSDDEDSATEEVNKMNDEIEETTSSPQHTLVPINSHQRNRGITLVTQHQLLAQMLSSAESLVYLSMRKGNMVQAQQVIKMFDLKESACASEAEFIEQMSMAVKDLKEKTVQPQLPSPSLSSTLLSPMTSVRSAVAAGLLSNDVRSIVDQLITHPHVSHSQTGSSDQDNEAIFSSYQTVAVCLDLIFSGCLGISVCKTLIDTADSSLEEISDNGTLSKPNMRTSITDVMRRLKGLVALLTSRDSSPTEFPGKHLPSTVAEICTDTFSQIDSDIIEKEIDKVYHQKRSFETLLESITKQEHGSEGTGGKELKVENKSKKESPFRGTINDILAMFHLENLCLVQGTGYGRDYVKVLVRHVDTLAAFQLYYKGKHSTGVDGAMVLPQQSLASIKARNPFLVLKDDMAATFGRLLFEWNTSPKRLESVAKQVNISLVKVIAKNCGITISVKREKKYQDLLHYLLMNPRTIVNESGNQDTAEKSPVTLVEDLLSQLITLLSGLSPNYSSIVGSKDVRNLVTSERFQEFQKSSTKLSSVDLEELTSESEKFCFFINLYNLLFAHGVLLIIGGSLIIDNMSNPDSQSRWSFESVMEKPAGRFAIQRFLSYRVGQLGAISAFDVFRHLLLGGISTTFYGDAFKAKPEWFQWTPELLKHAPSRQDNRCLFLLSHNTASCPPLKVWKPKDLDKRLNMAAKSFLEKQVFIDPSSMKVKLPKLLDWHRDFILPRQPVVPEGGISSTVDSMDHDLILLMYLANISPKFSKQLEPLNKSALSVIYSEQDWTLDFNLDMPGIYPRSSASRRSITPTPEPVRSTLTEPIRQYLEDVSPVSGAIITVAVNQTELLKQTEMIIVETKSSWKGKEGKLTTLTNFAEQGIQKLQKGAAKFPVLQNYIREASLYTREIVGQIKTLGVEQSFVREAYLKGFRDIVHERLSRTYLMRPLTSDCFELFPKIVEFCHHNGVYQVALTASDKCMDALPNDVKDYIICEAAFDVGQKISDLEDVRRSPSSTKLDQSRNEKLKRDLQKIILSVSDLHCRCQLVLKYITYFSVGDALDILEKSLEDCSSRADLVVKLKDKVDEVRWCDQVAQLVVLKDERVTLDVKVKHKPAISRWQDVSELVRIQPYYIAALLITCKAFGLVDFWLSFFSVPERLRKVALHAKLLHLLRTPNVNYLALQAAFRQVKCKMLALNICRDLLLDSDVTGPKSLFVIDYITNNYKDLLNKDEYEKLVFQKLGVEVLLLFPLDMQRSYHELVSRPLLILEQLLMNMKVELAGKVLESFRIKGKDEEIISPLLSDCDDILAKFGSLSLQVSILGAPSLDTNKGLQGSRAQSPDKPKMKRTSLQDKRHLRQSSGSFKTSGTPKGFEDEEALHVGNAPIKKRSSSKEKVGFVAPIKPVARKDWVRDDAVRTCMICELGAFSMIWVSGSNQ